MKSQFYTFVFVLPHYVLVPKAQSWYFMFVIKASHVTQGFFLRCVSNCKVEVCNY